MSLITSWGHQIELRGVLRGSAMTTVFVRARKWLRATLRDEPPHDEEVFRLPGGSGTAEDNPAREVVVDYWKRSLQGTDAARSRAQAGFTIVSAIATAFIGGAFLSQLRDQAAATVVLALLASALWLAAMGCYLNAATASSRTGRPLGGASRETYKAPPPGFEDETGPWSDVAANAVSVVQRERGSLVWRTQRANVVGMAAAIASALALAASALLPTPSEITATIMLSVDGAGVISRLCGSPTDHLLGEVNTDDLSTPAVSIDLQDPMLCRGTSTVAVRRDWIALVASTP